jgi:hypothetical protein
MKPTNFNAHLIFPPEESAEFFAGEQRHFPQIFLEKRRK